MKIVVVVFVILIGLVLLVGLIGKMYESGEEEVEKEEIDCDYCDNERFVVLGSRGDKLPCPKCVNQDRHFEMRRR